MVAIMESDPMDDLAHAEHAQRTAERAEAAPYIDFPPTPAWYPPAAGLWAGSLVAMLALNNTHSRLALFGIMALLVVQILFVRWYRAYHGALPSPKGAPPEFAGAFRRYTLGIVVVIAATAGVWLLLGPWVAAVTTAALVGVGLALYEKEYAAAAARTRERLG